MHTVIKSWKIKTIKNYNTRSDMFGSRRNHNHGAVQCLAKATKFGFFCIRRYGRSQCYGGISACYTGVRELCSFS